MAHPPAQHRREGDRVPDVSFRVQRDGQSTVLHHRALFEGRKVIVFSLPGAFTPTCSSSHLPRYQELAPTFQALGVDTIACISVNDPFVMAEWARDQHCDAITMLPDGNGEFTRGMGLLVDLRDDSFGDRSWRYAMFVRDGVIEKIFVEPDHGDDPYEVSDADTMLRYLSPDAKPPEAVAVLSRPGCPYCAKAKQLLTDAKIAFVDVPLDASIRARALSAIAGASTVPQVFVNGTRIGDSEAVERWVKARTAA